MKIQVTGSGDNKKIKMIICGPSGNGKTRSAVYLKRSGRRILIISCEAGLASISDENIDYIDISIDDNGALIPKEKRILRLMEIYKLLQTKEFMDKYDTIFIDSLSELSACLHDMLKLEFPDRKDSLVLFGTLSQKSKDLVRAFRDQPNYHIIFTCLNKIEKDDNGRRYSGFSMIGGIADLLPQYFDEVLQIRINQEGKKEFVCHATETMVCKDRSGKLLPVEPYDLGDIFNKILTNG